MTYTDMACMLFAALLQGIGSVAAPLVQAAIDAHKKNALILMSPDHNVSVTAT
jgi:hypothetical protein